MGEARPETLDLVHGTVDLVGRRFRPESGDAVPLSQREVDLLRYLAARPDHTVPRDDLLRDVWGWRAEGETRAVDAAIRRLRSKLEDEPSQPKVILGVYGEGYRLVQARSGTVSSPALPGPPRPLSPMLGREALLAQVSADLDGRRPLVTLVGPGGIGKTRLAIALARSATGRVAWLDLEGTTTAAQARHQVAAALGVRLPPHGDADDALAAGVGAPLLLVLDNLEQGAAALAPSVVSWLAADGLQILATSREALGIPGERVVDVPPLDPAVAGALYADRAQSAGHVPDQSEAEQIAALVRRLEGVPLAIELAAAWAPILEPRRVLDHIEDGSLDDPGGGRPERHASLRAVVRWSWDLLDEGEQRMAEACALFPAGCTAQALQRITEVEDTAAHLLALRRKSLLHAVSGPGRRLGMSGPVRHFADDQRALRGDVALLERFGTWCAEEAVALGAAFATRGDTDSLARLHPELGNFVAALETLDARRGAEVVLALGPALVSAGWFGVHRDVIDAVVGGQGVPPDARARLFQRRAAMALAVGAVSEAGPWIDAAREAAALVDDEILLAEVELDLGTVQSLTGEAARAAATTRRARVRVEQATTADPARLGRAWMVIGANLVDTVGRAEADAAYLQAVRCFEAAGSDRGRGAATTRLAGIALEAGDLSTASTHLAAAERWLAAGPTASLMRVRGQLAEAGGHHAEAEADARRVLALATGAGEPWTQYDARLSLSRLALHRGDFAAARGYAQLAAAFAAEQWRGGWVEPTALEGLAEWRDGRGQAARDVVARLQGAGPAAAEPVAFLRALLEGIPLPALPDAASLATRLRRAAAGV